MTTTIVLKSALGKPRETHVVQAFGTMLDPRLVRSGLRQRLVLADLENKAILVQPDDLERAIAHMAPLRQGEEKLGVSKGKINEEELRKLGFPYIESITHKISRR